MKEGPGGRRERESAQAGATSMPERGLPPQVRMGYLPNQLITSAGRAAF